MIQAEVPLSGTLRACTCKRQPRHFEVRGKGLHILECPPCGVSTGKHPTLQQAVEAWEAVDTVQITAHRSAA